MKTNPLMRNLFWLCILLVIAGCTDMSIEDISVKSDEEFYASFEDTDSRTYVDDQIRLRWTAEDCIALFRKTTYNREYMFTGVTGANAGGFKQKSIDDDFWYGADVPYNYAVYPYSVSTQLDETDYYFTLTMPDEQTYVENSFGLGANTMVAVSETGQLTFKNVGSYLRVRLYGEDVFVSSITLNSKGDESISGTAKVTPALNGYPTCEMIGTSNSIRLICPEPVAISNDANNPTDFWIVVPPVTLTNGFSVTVENSEGNTQVFEVTKTFTFERNMYTDMKREVSISSEDAIPYLTFTADAEQTFTMSKAVETLEYSVNGGEWKELGTNIVTFGGNYGKLQLRGKNNFGTCDFNSDNTTNIRNVKFGNETSVACSGDIRTLLDYENHANVYTGNARFIDLFANCEVLISAPQLPAVELADGCYSGMFSGCTNLTIAPELPATELADNCYSGMFQNCTSLTIAPNLPAKILTDYCYYMMFVGCTSLTTAPKLYAIVTANLSCCQMFASCTSLVDVPDLEATSLAPGCYNAMFSDCTSLTIAPKLPASTLAVGCYYMMFSKCTKLNTVTMLATNIDAEECLTGWLWYTATTGTFYKAENMTSLLKGTSGIPEGWTVVNYEDSNTFEDDGPPPVEDGGNVI